MVTQKDKKDNRMTRSSRVKRNFLQKTADSIVKIGKKLKNFFVSLKAELKRVVWPDRKRLIQSTATVLAICLMIGILLFVVDSILGGTLNALGFYSPNATTVATTAPAPTTTNSEPAETDGETTTQATTAAG